MPWAKNRRQVKCTMCTPDRWKGNAKDRFKAKDSAKRKDMKKQVQYINKNNIEV